ncbi:MAG TPA: class I SAM-dependent methyltransferase [Rhizomicrobium sp.]|jgi:predicted O-methyltransferase YrrM
MSAAPPMDAQMTTERMAADDFSALSESEAVVLRSVHEVCTAVYRTAMMNETTRPDCFKFLYSIMEQVPAPNGEVDYLEVGSFKGASLLVIASILRALGKLGDIVSIDPYFAEGYEQTPPFKNDTIVMRSTESTMRSALRLYDAAGLKVALLRDTSANAMVELMKQGRKFDFLYIDGNHEQLHPMVDTSLGLQLLRPGALLMLDDANWPDVKPVARLCRLHLKPVGAGFGKACFQV